MAKLGQPTSLEDLFMRIRQHLAEEVTKKIVNDDIESVKLCNSDSNALNGSSLCGYINATVNQMNSLFDVTEHVPSGDGKTKHEWDIAITEKDGKVTYISVYDYKEWPSSDDEVFEFHIGAHSGDEAKFGIAILESMLNIKN